MEVLETERLVLRRPRVSDEPAIFSRYASDPEATRFMAWPTHRTLDDTRAFLELSDDAWARWPLAGPYLVFARVLEKAGFVREGVRPGRFPNLPPGVTRDAALYRLSL